MLDVSKIINIMESDKVLTAVAPQRPEIFCVPQLDTPSRDWTIDYDNANNIYP